MIASFEVKNFRCFLEPTRIEIRPLTLLYGYNNAGKSVLARVLPLLADSIGEALTSPPTFSSPINLKSLAARGAAFSDLVSKLGDYFAFSVSLEWAEPFGASIQSVEYRIREFPELRQQVIENLALRDSHGRQALDAEWDAEKSHPTMPEHTYQVQMGQSRRHPMTLTFNGLTPSPSYGSKRKVDRPLADLANELGRLPQQVQWLTSLRRSPKRFDLLRGGGPHKIEPEGDNVAQFLASDKWSQRGEILSAVSQWYESNFDRVLDVEPEGVKDQFSLSMTPASRTEVRINLADTGEGIAQVLPVLVALERARRWRDGYPGLLVVEQPELHLHPQAQQALASRFCEVASGRNPPQVIVETHSEHFLLALQLRIVRGEVPRDNVRIYWVRQAEGGESRAELMSLDEEGRLPYSWPPDVFRENVEIARKVIQERRAREAE